MMEQFLADRAKQEAGNRFGAFTALEQAVLRTAFSYADDDWNGCGIEAKTFNKLFSELKAAMRQKGEADK